MPSTKTYTPLTEVPTGNKPGQIPITQCSAVLPNHMQCWRSGDYLVTETEPPVEPTKEGEQATQKVTHFQLCRRHAFAAQEEDQQRGQQEEQEFAAAKAVTQQQENKKIQDANAVVEKKTTTGTAPTTNNLASEVKTGTIEAVKPVLVPTPTGAKNATDTNTTANLK